MSSETAARSPLPGGPIRLSNVQGYEQRMNDVIYCPPLEKYTDENLAVVYFGGDIQDFPENMQVHHDSKAYIRYNLENTALLLRNNFPKAHIVVIKAVRMEFKTFSCYDNFVRGCNAGIPDHTPMNYSLQHLEKLLQNIPTRIRAIPDIELIPLMKCKAKDYLQGTGSSATASSSDNHTSESSPSRGSNSHGDDSSQEMDIDVLQVQENATADVASKARENADTELDATSKADMLWWRDSLNLDKAELTLIAFSKGSVVLNQFIYEFHYLKTLTPDDASMMRLVSRITDMYWLDGGHSAPKNTWITSRSLLETLTRLNIKIHVHVTPYQVLDDRRPWIRRDEKAFTDLLRRLGAPLTRILHFDGAVPNLFTHFEVLEVFKQQEQLQLQQQQQQPQVDPSSSNCASTNSSPKAPAPVSTNTEASSTTTSSGSSEAETTN